MDMNLHAPHVETNDGRETFEVVGGSRYETRATPALRKIAAAVSGSGWYHDAAIEQANRAAIEARCTLYG